MKKIVILFLISFCFFIVVLTNVTSAFASTTISNEIGTLSIEQDEFEVSYTTNQMIKIYGNIINSQSGGKVTIVLTMPDGSQDGSQIFTTNDGYFETFFPLNSKSQKGTYELFASYNAKIIGSLNFIVKEDISIKQPLTNFNQAISKHKSSEVKIASGSSTPGCEETNSCFDPHEAIVDVGGEVTWTNDDTAAHTVTSGDIKGEGPDGIFDSSLFGPGKTFSFKFEEAGTFNYFCMIHPWMTGMVTVGHDIIIEGNITPPETVQYVTQLSLEVKSGSSYGSVRVKPSITYNSGDPLPTSLIQILVDGNFKKRVSSNKWSGDISVDSGKHKIEAYFPKSAVPSDSVVYLSARDTEYFEVKPLIKNYYTSLSLQIRDSSNSDHIQVYPALTYGSVDSFTSSSVRIYVDGNDKGTVSSNEWSRDIWAGSGSHTIKAAFEETVDRYDSSIRYGASSDSVTHDVPLLPIPNNTSDLSMLYIIGGLAVAATIGTGIGLSRRKKGVPQVAHASSPQAIHVTSNPDETQFYGCPHCGQDTQIRYGKQYCSKCRIYL